MAALKGILSGSPVLNFPITFPVTAYVHLCMCDSVCSCALVFVFPWASECVSWVYFRHVWVVVCVTVSEIESRRDDLWMCDWSFTFGAVSLCVVFWLICWVTEEKLHFTITFKPDQSPY